MLLIPSKVVLLVVLNMAFLGKSQAVASEGREFPSYLPPEEIRPEYQIFQYPPNYPYKEDYSECAKNPMIPLLGKGLNLLLLKLGAVGIVKAVLALMFVGVLLKLPLVLLKFAFVKSFFLPLLMAPLLFNTFINHMTQSSDSKPDSAEKPEMEETPAMMGMNGGMMGMNGGMMGMNGGMMAPNGGMMAPSGGMMAANGGMMAPNGGMMAPNGGMMPPKGGMMASNGGMMAQNGGMMAPNGGMMADKPEDLSRAMTDVVMAMGRQLNDNLPSIAWDSLKMFADSDQCAEKISCMIGASAKDSSMENILTRILKYLHHSSPPHLRKRVTQIREAFQKGSRNSTCVQEDYECHSPELLLQYGVKKVKIL